MAITVTDKALATLDAADEATKRKALAAMTAEDRARIVAALPAWRARRSGASRSQEDASGGAPPVADSPGSMDESQAIAISGLPFQALTRRGAAAVEAGMGKAEQLFRSLGLIAPEERVSDELHQPPVRKNGKMYVEGNRLRDSGPMPEKSFGELYEQGFARNVALENQAEREHPGLSTTAGLISALLTPVPKVGRLAQGAGTGAKALHFGKQGAAAGALFGAGNSDADLSKGEYGRLALDTGLGVGAGASALSRSDPGLLSKTRPGADHDARC